MKKSLVSLILLFPLILFLFGCEKSDESPTSSELTEITISGMVISAQSGDPIDGATIKITDGDTLTGTVTNSQGSYSTVFGIDKDKDLLIIASKGGFLPDTVVIFATKDNPALEVPAFQLAADTSGGDIPSNSGDAASIYLFNQSSESIGVKESGALESAEIIFEVRDSNGVPIDLNHAVTVNFKFGSHPDGGEYLYPSSVKTNTLGRATVVLNSGTVAGVVQIVAEINTSQGIIRSKPVLIAIYGGLPYEGLFDVASEKLNYPKLGVLGFSIQFTAFVGDKYSNPVRPGTAVYFNTNSGIIDGSALTDDLGRATVTLLTQGNPVDSIYGPGFFTVSAYTADENYNTLKTQSLRLLSGGPILEVSPTSFSLPNGGSQTFTYTVHDINGNPMSEGQTITVSAKGEVEVAGDTEIQYPDVMFGYTSFSFVLYDKKPDVDTLQNVSVKILTNGPNGKASIELFGSAR